MKFAGVGASSRWFQPAKGCSEFKEVEEDWNRNDLVINGKFREIEGR